MNDKSLLDIIRENLIDGTLPHDFSLPKTDSDTEIVFADGAMDGIGLYHMSFQEMDEVSSRIMEDAVNKASIHDYDGADELFKELSRDSRAIYVIDALQSYILDNKDKLDENNIFEYAIRTFRSSDNRECIKYMMSILSLYELEYNEVLKDEIRTIGLSDEFSLFSIFIMKHWEDGNKEIFDLARKVHGWGRIHAIDYLEPETEEIKDWLLKEGIHNDVMCSYSALSCFEKADAETRLMNDPTYEELTYIRDIISALLDEGPVSGISAIDDDEKMISIFLEKAQEYSDRLTLEDYEVINEIRKYYSQKLSDKCAIAITCKKILVTYHARCVILDAVKEGRGIEVAMDSGVDVKPYVLDLMNKSFREHNHLCRYLSDDEEYRKKMLDIFRKNLPLQQMKTMPKDILGLSQDYWKQRALELLMQELERYPFEGKEFVETGLQSEPVRTRNGALEVLRNWVKITKKPLADILFDLQVLLMHLRSIEPVDDVMKQMDELIEGETVFDTQNQEDDVQFDQDTLNILSDAISDMGSWCWWYMDEDMIQLEFTDVQLYDDSKPEKGPHSSIIALRFYDDSFAMFLDNLEEDGDKKWYEKLAADEIAPYDIDGYDLSFNDSRHVNEVIDSYRNRYEIKKLKDDDIISVKYIIAARCDDVAFVAGGNHLEVVSHTGNYTADEIKDKVERWWDYWKDYWNKRGTKDAYEKDYVCETTIPVGDE